ncbi:MAG TPA: SPOR domain-containing protein [Bryobacteraceae bacterium]|jgi:cell division septation protein DedD
MTRTEGEHELVLGNKQLLSAFFVVVVLLGVFFTMGYFVGKNTATSGFNSGAAAASGGQRPDAVGKPVDNPASSSSSAPESTTPAASDTTAGSGPGPAPDNPSSAPPVDAKPEPRSEPLTSAATSDSSRTEMAQPSSEQKYLQVSAVRRPDADNMVKVLKERGFPALLGESSKQGLYRVLVGPFKTNTELAHAKLELKSKGFDSIVAR